MILDDALDDTRLQRFAPDLGMLVTWNGGTTFNVWSYSQIWVTGVDVFTMADAPDFDGAVAAIDSYFDRAPGPADHGHRDRPHPLRRIDANAAQVRKMVTTEGVPVEARRYLARALLGHNRPTGEPYRFRLHGVVTVRATTANAATAILARRLADVGDWEAGPAMAWEPE